MKKLADTSLIDILLFSLAFITLIIGIDQSIRFGLVRSYWLFTVSIFCLLIYNLRKQRKITAGQQAPNNKPTSQRPKTARKK